MAIGLIAFGAPAAVALPAAVLLSITIELSMGEIGLAGTMSQTSPAARQLVQNGIEQLEELKWAAAKVVLPQVVGAYTGIALGAHSLVQAFTSALPATTVTNETYVGTFVFEETSSSPNSGGCMPDPFIVTSSGTPSQATLVVTSGSILAPGPFSGTLSVNGYSLTVNIPTVTCPNGDGTYSTVPGSSTQQSVAAAGGPVSGTGGGASPISVAPIPVAGGTATVASSIDVAPGTGAVTLTINITVVSSSGGISIDATGAYNLVKQ